MVENYPLVENVYTLIFPRFNPLEAWNEEGYSTLVKKLDFY